MKILTAKKGDPFESVDMDIVAMMNSKIGNIFLDKENAFKEDTDIIFVKKRRSKHSPHK